MKFLNKFFPNRGATHNPDEERKMTQAAISGTNEQATAQTTQRMPVPTPEIPPTAEQVAEIDQTVELAVETTEEISQEDQIRLNAYYKWEQAGYPEGTGEEFWLEAEREASGEAEATE